MIPHIAELKVIIVILRRPDPGRCDEMRTDPLWEFGSFGLTHCHKRNLLNPGKIHVIKGARFAFAQGGATGFRLVHLTPPIEPKKYCNCAEATWSPAVMPFKYAKAPLIIDNRGKSDFPSLRDSLKSVNRTTWEAKFSSSFRSRRAPLEPNVANEFVGVFEDKLQSATPASFASSYVEALPYLPSRIDKRREETYKRLLNEAMRG